VTFWSKLWLFVLIVPHRTVSKTCLKPNIFFHAQPYLRVRTSRADKVLIPKEQKGFIRKYKGIFLPLILKRNIEMFTGDFYSELFEQEQLAFPAYGLFSQAIRTLSVV
jgi:hypothetical protein